MTSASLHLRRIPISRFCLHGLNTALLLYVCPLAVSEDSVPSTNEYETPGQVNAEDFLPKSAFAGKKLFVEKVAQNNGLQNTYRIRAGGGGLAFDIGTLPVGGAAGIGLTVIGIEQTVDSLINDSSPDSLRNCNEENLLKMGANRDLIVQFLTHPWYTLKQATTITASLNKTEINPDLFLESANKALTERDGRYFEHIAKLLAAYSQKVTPLQSFRLQDGLLCAVDRDGVLLVPVSLDYAIWTATVAQRVDALAGLKSSDPNIKSVEIWTDGKASERVKVELGKRALGYQSFPLVKTN